MYTFKQKNNRRYVTSRIINFIEYDNTNQLLKIGFNDGMIGFYSNFPSHLYKEFQSASSKGEFFFKNIQRSGFKRRFESA